MEKLKLSFTGRESLNNDVYDIDINLYSEVNPLNAKFHVRPRSVEIVLEKVRHAFLLLSEVQSNYTNSNYHSSGVH